MIAGVDGAPFYATAEFIGWHQKLSAAMVDRGRVPPSRELVVDAARRSGQTPVDAAKTLYHSVMAGR